MDSRNAKLMVATHTEDHSVGPINDPTHLIGEGCVASPLNW